MSELTEILNKSVESATKKLLLHFKEQYGSTIFIPLGVNENSTPAKIVPGVVPAFEQYMLSFQDDNVVVLMQDDKVGAVFDSFMNAFFSSLNFLVQGIMKGLGLKMTWNDFKSGLAKRKAEDQEGYNRWKNNLTLVIKYVFEEIVDDLKGQGKNVKITDGVNVFSTVSDAIEKLEIFA